MSYQITATNFIARNNSKRFQPYISLNTKYRVEAKNDLEENQYKFLSNSVFGKIIQNDRNKRDIRPVIMKKQEIDSLLQ